MLGVNKIAGFSFALYAERASFVDIFIPSNTHTVTFSGRYADLISKATHDDYVFLAYGIKMAEYGFFDLSDELIQKLDTNLYTENYVRDIKKFYYPSGMVSKKDLLYLADAYAGITYNNLAIETTSELLNSTQAAESDYKNFLISLGFYKSNNLVQALKYINNAIVENNTNVNYKILKAKILADSNKPKQAQKALKEIQKQEFLTKKHAASAACFSLD